jgi:zinc transport system ATP-binding protein
MAETILQLDDVGVNFERFVCLKNISFAVKRGDFVNIVGANGAGKTTLIKTIIQNIRPSSGKITLNTSRIGYQPQQMMVGNSVAVTVKEFIYTGFERQKLLIGKDDRQKMLEWLELFCLPKNYLDKRIYELSGGETQRVFLIRALISGPELVVLDEPSSNLDASFRQTFYGIIQKLRTECGSTFINVTHEADRDFTDDELILVLDRQVRFFGDYPAYQKYRTENGNV